MQLLSHRSEQGCDPWRPLASQCCCSPVMLLQDCDTSPSLGDTRFEPKTMTLVVSHFNPLSYPISVLSYPISKFSYPHLHNQTTPSPYWAPPSPCWATLSPNINNVQHILLTYLNDIEPVFYMLSILPRSTELRSFLFVFTFLYVFACVCVFKHRWASLTRHLTS